MPDPIGTRLRDLAASGARVGRLAPLESVRHRGTQRRQRHLVAAAFVAVAAVILAAGGTALALRPSASPQPAAPLEPTSTTFTQRDVDTFPTSTPEPVPTARQLPTDAPAGTIIAIPEDVTVLFEDHEVTGQEGESLAIDESIARPWVLDPCTWSGYETDELRTDMRTVDFSPWLENFHTHQLAVYPNETVAVAVLEDFRSALGVCRPDLDPAGRTQEWVMASVTAPGYESYTVINCCTETVHTTAYAIVRQRNAVYVGLLSSEGGLDALTDVEGWAREMEDRMCVFAFSC